MKVLIILLLAINLFSYEVNYSNKYISKLKSRYTKELNHLSLKQIKTMLKVYSKAKPFDLSLTMVCISWQESQFGKYMMNLSDPSFGNFHNNINSVLKRHDYSINNWNKSRVAQRLMEDFDFSFTEALSELQYWKSYWKSKGTKEQWVHYVRSYNTGYRWSENEHYIDNIIIRMRVLRKFISKHKELFDRVQYK